MASEKEFEMSGFKSIPVDHVPAMTPGDCDFDIDEDGNAVTVTLLEEGVASVAVVDDVHNVIDARIVEVGDTFGEHHFDDGADDESLLESPK